MTIPSANHLRSTDNQPLRRGEETNRIGASARPDVITRIVLTILKFFNRETNPLVTRSDRIPVKTDHLIHRVLDFRPIDTQRLNSSSARRGRSEALTKRQIEEIGIKDLNEVKNELGKIARSTNGAWLHCSPNCDWRSQVFLHTVTSGEQKFSVKNHFVPTSTREISKHIFGEEQLQTIGNKNVTLEEAKEIMLHHFDETGERHYLICSTHYRTPWGETTKHAFNAMIVTTTEISKDREGNPEYVHLEDRDHVQFIDPWKTSKPTPTERELIARHTEEARFTIQVRKPRA